MNEALKIISLEASNIKVLKAIRITPDKNVITLTGANGAGKSSVLDAISYALGGADEICDQPIRHGASSAKIVCTLNDLIITRKFGPTGTTLTVTTIEGVPQKSPQTMLDSIVGNLAFDPLSFARMDAAQQVLTMRKLVGLDFTALDQEKAKLYAERTMINREYHTAKTLLETSPHFPDAPTEEVSVDEINKEIASAEEKNAANSKIRNEANRFQELANQAAAEANGKLERVTFLTHELERITALLKTAKEEHASAVKNTEEVTIVAFQKAKLAGDVADISLQPLLDRIGTAGETNRKVRANLKRKEHQKTAAEKLKAADELTRKIEEIDANKAKQLADAKFPLPNLSFDDGAVLLEGVPFSQASDGEKLRVSVAVGMALNPKLRVIFIRDGSLLDTDGLRMVAELAEKNNYQVWLEDARSTDPTALVIEDGEIKA